MTCSAAHAAIPVTYQFTISDVYHSAPFRNERGPLHCYGPQFIRVEAGQHLLCGGPQCATTRGKGQGHPSSAIIMLQLCCFCPCSIFFFCPHAFPISRYRDLPLNSRFQSNTERSITPDLKPRNPSLDAARPQQNQMT